jgi:hypothetical protein
MSYEVGKGARTWNEPTTEGGLLPACWGHPRNDGYAALVHHQGENERTLCGIKYRDWYFEAYDVHEIEMNDYCITCYRCVAVLRKRSQLKGGGEQ